MISTSQHDEQQQEQQALSSVWRTRQQQLTLAFKSLVGVLLLCIIYYSASTSRRIVPVESGDAEEGSNLVGAPPGPPHHLSLSLTP